MTNFGVGLDVGTSNLLCMTKDENGKEILKSIRDCYFELVEEDVDFIKDKGQMKLTNMNDRHFALGEDALVISNWLKKPVKRPMAQGVLNPTDDDGYLILEELISKIVGPARYKGETCVASIPADSIDGEINTITHKGAIKQILTKLGYSFVPINEGFATLISMNPIAEKNDEKMPFTGIALSCGGGMVNLCLAYRSKPMIQLSTSKGGDWIDLMTSKSFADVRPNQVTKFKENYFKFNKNYTDDEIESFGYKTTERKRFFKKMMFVLEQVYENMIESTIESFKEKMKEENIDIEEELEIVISGGTASPEGFEQKFLDVLQNSGFPIQIKGIRKNANTLISTVTGALIWSLNLERKKEPATPTPTPTPETQTPAIAEEEPAKPATEVSTE